MMNNSKKLIADTIKQNNTFAIFPHVSPDSDALGSCYAMKQIIEKMGKSAVVYVQEPIGKYLYYLGQNCEVFSGAKRIDVCIVIDCADINRLGERKAFFDTSDISINIDHHYTNTNFCDINLVCPEASSAGEICYDIIKELGETIDYKTANFLYSAICSDTGGFKYSNTSPYTMHIAAELIEKGADTARINKAIFDTESYDQIRLKGELSQSIRLYYDGKIGVVAVSKAQCKKYGVDMNDIDNIVDIVRRIEGVETAISLKESDNNITKVSLRANEYCDVSKIAMHFGGGGHVKAAGATINDSIKKAEKAVVDEAIRVMKEYEK